MAAGESRKAGVSELRVYGLSSSGKKGSRKATAIGVDKVTHPGQIYGVEVLRTEVKDRWVISNYFSSLEDAKECAANYNRTDHTHAFGDKNWIARVVCNVANKVEAAYDPPAWYLET